MDNFELLIRNSSFRARTDPSDSTVNLSDDALVVFNDFSKTKDETIRFILREGLILDPHQNETGLEVVYAGGYFDIQYGKVGNRVSLNRLMIFPSDRLTNILKHHGDMLAVSSDLYTESLTFVQNDGDFWTFKTNVNWNEENERYY